MPFMRAGLTMRQNGEQRPTHCRPALWVLRSAHGALRVICVRRLGMMSSFCHHGKSEGEHGRASTKMQRSVLFESADAFIRESPQNLSDIRADVGIRAPVLPLSR